MLDFTEWGIKSISIEDYDRTVDTLGELQNLLTVNQLKLLAKLAEQSAEEKEAWLDVVAAIDHFVKVSGTPLFLDGTFDHLEVTESEIGIVKKGKD